MKEEGEEGEEGEEEEENLGYSHIHKVLKSMKNVSVMPLRSHGMFKHNLKTP